MFPIFREHVHAILNIHCLKEIIHFIPTIFKNHILANLFLRPLVDPILHLKWMTFKVDLY